VGSRPAPAYLLLVDSVRKGEEFQIRISSGSSPIYVTNGVFSIDFGELLPFLNFYFASVKTFLAPGNG